MCGVISMRATLRGLSWTFLQPGSVPGMVRMWRHQGVLLMHGPSTGYAAEPRGEYFVGVIEGGAMRARRGSVRYAAGPGDLCVWDPSAPHRGSGEWTARLMVL